MEFEKIERITHNPDYYLVGMYASCHAVEMGKAHMAHLVYGIDKNGDNEGLDFPTSCFGKIFERWSSNV